MKNEEVLFQINVAEKATARIKENKKYQNIIFPAIEKSEIVESILEDLYPDIPFIAIEYDSISEIQENSLVVIQSYAGATPEIVSFYKKAQLKTKNILVLTSGKGLLEDARKKKFKVVELPTGYKSRASFFLLFFSVYFALARLGVFEIDKEGIEETKKIIAEFASNYKTFQFVHTLKSTVPAIYTWDQFHSIGSFVKFHLNVMAKMYAIHSTLPEADYTDIEALAYGDSHVTPVFIYPAGLSNAQKIMNTVETIASKHAQVLHYTMVGNTSLAQVISAILFFKLVAQRLAIARGVDPYSRDAVQQIKSQFKKL